MVALVTNSYKEKINNLCTVFCCFYLYCSGFFTFGNGAKVIAAIYSSGRCMAPGAHNLGWQGVILFFFFLLLPLPFYFNCWSNPESDLNLEECQW